MIKVDSTHYYRYFREGTLDVGDAGVIQEQTSADGVHWGPAETIFADQSGSCNEGNLDFRDPIGGVLPDGEQFLTWDVGCGNPPTLIQVDYAQTTNGQWGSYSKFSTVTDPDYLWVQTTSGPTFQMPNGEAGMTMGGCAAGGNCQTVTLPLHMWIITTCNNGKTWGDPSCPNSLIPISNAQHATLPTNEVSLIWTGGKTLIGFDRNYLYGGSGWDCSSASCPLVFLSSTDLGAHWTFIVTNFQPSCSDLGPVTSDNMVSPSLYDPGLDGQLTVLWAERCYYSNGSSSVARGYLQALTFDPQTAISNPTSFSTPQTLWTGNYNDWGYQSCAFISGNKMMSCYWDSEQYPGGPLNLMGARVMYTLPRTLISGSVIKGMVLH